MRELVIWAKSDTDVPFEAATQTEAGVTFVILESPEAMTSDTGELLSALERHAGTLSDSRRRQLHAAIGALLKGERAIANSPTDAATPRVRHIARTRAQLNQAPPEDDSQTAYISTDSRGVILDANHAAAALFNRTAARLTGKCLTRLVVIPDRDALRMVLKRVVRGGDMRQLEVTIKPFRLDPATIALTVAAVSDKPGHLGELRWLLHNITDRRRGEDLLRKSEAELRMITSQMPSSVWTTDADLRVQRAIGANHGPIGKYSRIDIGLTLYEICGGDAASSQTIAAHKRALRGETATCEIEIHDRAFEVRVEPLRDDTSRINGCIGLAIDVTERRHTQEEIRLLQTELAHASRLNVVGGMAAGIAHELNQPLTAIVAYTQACVRLLKSGKGKLDDLIATLERVADQGLRAGRIIRRMKSVSGARSSPIRSADVNMLVTEVISFVDWEAHRHRVLIRRNLDDELPKIMVDTTAVTQVMLILLKNAIQALEDSEGERQIVVRTYRAEDMKRVEISITDSGPGLPTEYLDHLFEPFFSTKPDGVGMGLPISRSLIEGQGGRLWVVPGSLGGACFRFTLPIDDAAPYHES